MKKAISSVIMSVLIFTMVFSLTSCGGEKTTLNNKTANGISISVPSDFSEFKENGQNLLAVNTNSTATIGISKVGDAQGSTVEDWDKDTFVQSVATGFSDVKFTEFKNTATVSGLPAVYTSYTAKNSSGIAITCYNYLIYHDDGTFQTIAISFNSDADSSLKKNVDAVMSSVKIV